MDSSKKYKNPSPEESANILSRLLFWWILPFFKFGYKNDLEPKDLYNATESDLSQTLGDTLEKNWEKELSRVRETKEKPELLRAIKRTFLKQYVVHGIVLFLQCVVLRLVHPLVLAEFINYFDPEKTYMEGEGWLFAVAIVLIAFFNILIMHHTALGCQRIGMRCRVACCSLLYRKLLKLNKTSLGQTAVGQIVNLMSNDVARFDLTPVFLHYMWIMPIQAVAAALIMYNSVGWAALAGLAAITLQAVPLQGYLSRLQGKIRFRIAERTDHRVKLMSEITSGIQVIKMYAWEKPFAKVVEIARKLEIDEVTKTSYIRGFSLALMVFTERATLFVTVITYVLMENRLTGDKVFSMAQFFNTIQLYMAIFYPLALSLYAEAKVSVKRLETFLNLEENVLERNDVVDSEKIGAIKLVKVKASWIPNPIIDTLNNFNLEVKPGTLCCVVGPVGSGKSSLLQLLLKELPLNSGSLEIVGSVSYASQEPWLFVSTVRNNILFDQPNIKNRYKDVVEVCALERDFQQLSHGDRTLVGERGVSLSGGQRARINLARAVYRQADIYLFDDPLSAVDTHVAKHLFERCIKTYLKDKTRILVTHQVQFLKQADAIVIINNGQIEKIGTYDELEAKELSHLKEETHPEENTDKSAKNVPLQRLKSVSSTTSTNDDEETEEPEETQELMEKGSISSSLYLEYFKAGSGVFFLLLLAVTLILAQMASNGADFWVTYWTNKEETRYLKWKESKEANETSFNTTELPLVLNNASFTTETLLVLKNQSFTSELSLNETNRSLFDDIVAAYSNEKILPQPVYIYVYTFFIVGSIVLTTLRSLMFFKICMNASKNLHKVMFSNVIQATMRFFDTNPSGRILNRFSKDMGAVDELLPRCMLESIQIFLVMTGILVMVVIVSPWMIAPTLMLGVFFVLVRIVYLSSAQDIKRLEGITRAPVFSHVSASLSGLTTIRSSGAQSMITKEFDSLQDQHTSSWFLFLVTSSTFGFYLDIISLIFLAIVTLQFLLFDKSNILPGDVGLVISQSLILTGMLQFGIRQTAEVANQMTSVERIIQYTKLEKEGPFETLQKPHRDWPQKGLIKFNNTNLRYVPENAPVLRNLNLEIAAGSKVGIVGRTGAGKSSLIAALFRLAPIEGVISIDDVDTKSVGLFDLRTNISIIPQEPVLFSATIRHNLDPFDKCDDKTLWQALENVELKDVVENLDQNVSEGGTNFSAGQRQLMCLARAIIRNNRILVMDEATANVDPQTDSLIQNTIRTNFKDCTVLTIAHRLNTVMDSDEVIVMEAGEVVEFGPPYELLQKTDGFLNKMVKETDKSMESKLRQIATQSYVKVPKKT